MPQTCKGEAIVMPWLRDAGPATCSAPVAPPLDMVTPFLKKQACVVSMDVFNWDSPCNEVVPNTVRLPWNTALLSGLRRRVSVLFGESLIGNAVFIVLVRTTSPVPFPTNN